MADERAPRARAYHFYVNDPDGEYDVATVCGTAVDVFQATLGEPGSSR